MNTVRCRGQAPVAYSIGAIAVTILLARDGSVARVVIGELTWDELHAFVAEQLALPQPSAPPLAPSASPAFAPSAPPSAKN